MLQSDVMLTPRRTKILLTALLAVITGALYFALGPRFDSDGNQKSLISSIVNTPAQLPEDDSELPDISPVITEFGLEIPSLSIKVPIVANVDGEKEKLYQKITAKLGIAHLKDTALPDQTGNVYLFGHSSFWLNYPGEYKEIFKNLDQVKKDETFTLYYKGSPSTYKVFENKIVAADDFSVLDPTPKDDKDSTITIQTCWPPGTDTKRLVVFAKKI